MKCKILTSFFLKNKKQRRLAQFLKEKIRHLEHELETIDEHCQIIIEIPKKHKGKAPSTHTSI